MKLYFLLVLIVVAGCKTAPPATLSPPPVVEPISPPMPPELPVKRQSIRALATIIPDKWIVVRWDQDPDPATTYVVDWHRWDEWTMDPPYHYATTSTKVDMVALFKSNRVQPGWYVVQVSAVNSLFVSSESIKACYVFWKP